MLLKKKILILFISCLISLTAIGYFLVFTDTGSVFVTRFGIKHYTKSELEVISAEGNLAQGITYSDLELNNIKIFPEGSNVKIQQLDVSLDALNIAGLSVNVHNARIFISDVDTILVYGTLQNSNLNGSVYCKNIPVRALFDLLPFIKNVKNISGIVEDFDIKIQEGIFNPRISGSLFIRELKWNQFIARNCPVVFDLRLSDIQKNLKLKGSVSFKSGEVLGNKTALIKLQESSIIFTQELMDPEMSIFGNAIVENTKIKIIVKGKIDSPEIILNSEPVLAKDKLIMMLATNQSWSGVSGSLENSQIGSEMSADLMNYFFFGTAGRKIAKLLGVDSVSLKYDGKTKQAEFRKEMSNSTGIKYGIEQKNNIQEDEAVSQKVAIDQKLSDNISIEAERKLDNSGKQELEDNGETNLWLKFKKGF